MTSIAYPIRVDSDVKAAAAAVADYYGFDLPTVTRAFWKQMIRTQSIPLSLRSEEPNDESLEAIRETEEIIAQHKAGEGYRTARELLDAARAQ